MTKKKLVSLLFFVLVIPVLSQSRVTDSLEKILPTQTGQERFYTLIELTKVINLSDPAKGLQYAEEAYILAEELDDPQILLVSLNTLAIVYYYLGDQRTSLGYLLAAINLMRINWERDSTNSELLYRLTVSLGNAGNVYEVLGEYDKSLEVFLLSLRYIDRLVSDYPAIRKYFETYIKCMNNTALVYLDMNQPEKAKVLFHDALALSRKNQFDMGIAMTLNNLGLIEIEEEHYQNALVHYQETLAINVKLNDSISVGGTYNNLGLIYEKMRDFKKALTYYRLSLEISDHLNYLFGVSNTCNNIGKIFTLTGQTDSALVYLRRGLQTAIQGNMKNLIKENYQNQYQLYQSTGQWYQALEAYRNYTEVKDSIFTSEKAKQIANLEARYESEKKEKENELLRKDVKIYQSTKKLLFVAISALLLLAGLLFILFRYKSRLLKQRSQLFEQEQQVRILELEKKDIEHSLLEDRMFAEQEINRLQRKKLDEQNRKLAATAIQITGKNKILMDILDELDSAKQAEAVDPKTCFQRIRNSVGANINFDRDWDQFKLHFEEVHPDFFIRLNTRFPDLTSGEQKICAYYRINLSTKEIAQILNVTIAAVQKSRHRLRKKMGIDSEVDMAELMLGI